LKDIRSEQKSILKALQERKTIDDIVEDLDFKQRTVYHAIEGMSSSYTDSTPRKWITEKDYLIRKEVVGLRNNYFLTPEGMRQVENLQIELDPEQSNSQSLEECELCSFDDPDCLHRHHVIPRSQGGSNDDSNIVVVCANCHAKIHKLVLDGIHPVRALNKVASQKIVSVKNSMRVD